MLHQRRPCQRDADHRDYRWCEHRTVCQQKSSTYVWSLTRRWWTESSATVMKLEFGMVASISSLAARSTPCPRSRSKCSSLRLLTGYGFPAPIIDWFYIADLLKVGGILVIDDLQIWTCEILAEFLSSEEDSISLERMSRSVAFRKNGDTAQHKDWVNQRFVMQRSKGARFFLAAKSTVVPLSSRD